MKNIFNIRFILVAFCFMTIQSFGQDLSVKWNPAIETERMGSLGKAFGTTEDGGFYAYRRYSRSQIEEVDIEKHDKDNKLVFSKPIRIQTDEGLRLIFEDMIMLGNRPVVIQTSYNKKEKLHTIYATRYDANGEKEARLKLDEFSSDKDDQRRFLFHVSADGQNLLVYHGNASTEETTLTGTYQIYDKELKSGGATTVELPYEEYSSIGQVLLTNDKKVLLLGSWDEVNFIHYRYYKSIKHSEKAKHFVMLCAPGAKPITKKLEMEEKIVSDLKIAINTNTGKVICAGFYKFKDSKQTEGTFSLAIDLKTGAASKLATLAFDTNKAKELDQWLERDEPLFINVREIIPNSDGSAYVIGEFLYTFRTVPTEDFHYFYISPKYNKSMGSVGAEMNNSSYYFNSIALARIAPDNSISWTNIIHKKQSSGIDEGEFCSFQAITGKEKLYLVYNEMPKNIDKLNPGDMYTMGEGQKSNTIVCTVNTDGTFAKKTVFSNKETPTVFCPTLYYATGSRDAIVYGVWQKKSRFGRLKLME